MTEQDGGPRRVPADGGRAQLLAAVELVLSVPPSDLSAQDSLARTDAVLLARTRLRAAELAGVRDIDTRELYALGEAGSVRTWLGQRPYAAGGGPRVTLARRLESSPTAWAALASATVAPQTVEQALGAADRVPTSVIHAAEAGETGVHDTPGRPAVDPVDATDAAARVAAALADGIPTVVGTVADPEALQAQCRALADDLTVPVVERLVTGFLLVARHVAPARYRAAIRDLFEALLPQPEPGDDEAYAHRAFTLTKHFDGWWRADGDLSPEVGDRLNAELEAEVAAQHKRRTAQAEAAQAAAAHAAESAETAGRATRTAAQEGAGATSGTTPSDTDPSDTDPSDTDPNHAGAGAEAAGAGPGATAGDPLDLRLHPSAAAQRHDALAALLFGNGPRPAATPMTIVIGAGRLLGEPGAPAARTADGHPVTDAAVGAAFCSTRITALITGARRQPLDLYRTKRDADTHQRKALNATWGPDCATLGCGNPGLIPHHVLPWHLDGETNIDCLRLLCPSCHDDVHLGGRTITLRDASAIGPYGWVRRPPPTRPVPAPAASPPPPTPTPAAPEPARHRHRLPHRIPHRHHQRRHQEA